MTTHLSSSPSSGRDGCALWGSRGSPAGLYCSLAGRTDGARNGRNQCITDFFQPAPKQDRVVLCSPEKRNGKVGFPVSHTDHPRRNMSSPKQNGRKKFPPPPSNRSPIIEALFKGAKIEKKDSSNVDGVSITVKATYPKDVARKLFTSEGSPDCSFRDDTSMKDLEKSEKCPLRTRTPLVENSRECKMEYMDTDTISSGLNRGASASENDSLCKESHVSRHQKTGCSKTLQSSPASASHQSLLETPGSDKKVEKEKKLFKQQPSASVKKSLKTSALQKASMDCLRKISSSASWESSTDDCSTKRASKVAFSSGQLLNEAIKIRKSQSCPSVYALSRTSLRISRHKEHPGKQKKISSNSDLKKSQKLVGKSLDTLNFSVLPEKHRSERAKHRRSSGGMELKDINPSESGLPLSTEYLNIFEENGNCDSYETLSPLQFGCVTNQNSHIRTSDAKESQTVPSKSYVEKRLPLCQEQIGIKAPSSTFITTQDNSLFFKEPKVLLFRIQNDNLFGTQKMKIDVRDSPLSLSNDFPSTSCSSFSKAKEEKTWKGTSNHVSSPVDCDHVTIPPSSCDLNEASYEDSDLEMCTWNKKSQSLFDAEDENPDCSLDSSDDEMLLPFEEIMAQSARASKNPEPTNDDDVGDNTQDMMIPSSTSLLSKPSTESQVSYVSRLEHLLKEKEEFRRVAELKKQLQEVTWQVQGDSAKELSDDGELSAEHRAFIERFSVIDAIPDQHPGENIFQMAHAGKIFNQHNLDLRNSGLFPHNPVEKYLLGSGIKQQLFVINEGLLMSAYYSSPCPVPILKWMFQMMSVNSDRFVSKMILDMLMELTVKNALVSDQPRPWIPSLSDIAMVLINMGAPFNTLFPVLDFQPSFTEDNIMSEMYKTVRKQATGDFTENLASFFLLVQSSLSNMAKFLQLCVGICPEHYTDKEILLLLLLLFKLSLEKELKKYPLVDLQHLIMKLLENIRKWDMEMPKLCLEISYLSSHHHDLLWLVQFVPNWTSRGRQARRHLSLVVISKLLKNHVNIPSSQDQQMALLCKNLVKMKPSYQLKRISSTEKFQDGLNKESLLSEFEPQAYYLTYVLLHLVREASNSDASYSDQRKWLLQLCGTLEKHVKCDIKEDARLFYRTKVKDLVARTYSKWQQMIHSSQPTQGKIHDFWNPDS